MRWSRVLFCDESSSLMERLRSLDPMSLLTLQEMATQVFKSVAAKRTTGIQNDRLSGGEERMAGSQP